MSCLLSQGFGMNSASLTQVLMPGRDVVVAGAGLCQLDSSLLIVYACCIPMSGQALHSMSDPAIRPCHPSRSCRCLQQHVVNDLMANCTGMTGDNEGFAIDYYLNEREQCNYATGGVRAPQMPACCKWSLPCPGQVQVCLLLTVRHIKGKADAGSAICLYRMLVCAPTTASSTAPPPTNVCMLSYSNTDGVVRTCSCRPATACLPPISVAQVLFCPSD